jgi:hypothetical protein
VVSPVWIGSIALERSIVDQGAARRTDVHVVTAKRSPIDRVSIGELAIDRGARRR